MQKRTRFALIACLAGVLALEGSASTLLARNFVSSFIWRSGDPKHGGYSGLELSDDGLSFTAISDRAGWTHGQIIRNAEGRITGLKATPVTPLLGKGNRPLRGLRADSEGLAMAPNGTAFISFEGKGAARVMVFPSLEKPGKDLKHAPEFSTLRANAALEALALGPDGTLYTLPESPRGAGPLPVFRLRKGKWDHKLHLPRTEGFDPVGADFGPDGRFYLLERGFHGVFGFSSRVRSFALKANAFIDERLEMQSAPATHDNLEGLSVWRDARGDIRLTMIADDNFFWAQRNEIVEYRVLP